MDTQHPPEPQTTKRKSSVWLWSLLPVGVLILALVAFLLFTVPGHRVGDVLGFRIDKIFVAQPAVPCSEAMSSYIYDGVGPLVERWRDTGLLALKCSRLSIAPLISDLQDIKRETEAVEAPPCGGTAKSLLLTAMQSFIDGCTAFMDQEPDATVEAYFTQSTTAMDEFTEEWQLRLQSAQ